MKTFVWRKEIQDSQEEYEKKFNRITFLLELLITFIKPKNIFLYDKYGSIENYLIFFQKNYNCRKEQIKKNDKLFVNQTPFNELVDLKISKKTFLTKNNKKETKEKKLLLYKKFQEYVDNPTSTLMTIYKTVTFALIPTITLLIGLFLYFLLSHSYSGIIITIFLLGFSVYVFVDSLVILITIKYNKQICIRHIPVFIGMSVCYNTLKEKMDAFEECSKKWELDLSTFARAIKDYEAANVKELNKNTPTELKKLKHFEQISFLSHCFSDFLEFTSNRPEIELPNCQYAYFFQEAISRVKEYGGNAEFCRLLNFYLGIALTESSFNTDKSDYEKKQKNEKLHNYLMNIIDKNYKLYA